MQVQRSAVHSVMCATQSYEENSDHEANLCGTTTELTLGIQLLLFAPFIWVIKKQF